MQSGPRNEVERKPQNRVQPVLNVTPPKRAGNELTHADAELRRLLAIAQAQSRGGGGMTQMQLQGLKERLAKLDSLMLDGHITDANQKSSFPKPGQKSDFRLEVERQMKKGSGKLRPA